MAARLQDKLKTQLKTAGKGSNTDITKYKYQGQYLGLFTLKIFQKMRMSEKCCNNSDNPLTSCRTNGGKKNVKNDNKMCKI